MSLRTLPGVVLPQQEIGLDAGALRQWARELERLGCAEIEAFDHVLGADPSRWPDGPPPGHDRIPYTYRDAFHEPLVLFSHLAAATTAIGFATTVLILPQRQTALVAKQCAELSLLSEGRLRLGVGLGWNHVEYEALGIEFTTRGRRLDEQIGMLRALFAGPLVEREGEWDRLDRVGINPLPGWPIPIWVGGVSDAAIRRAAQLGDGWALNLPASDPRAATALARLDEELAAAGRDREEFEVSAWIHLPGRSSAAWREDLERWRELGIDRFALVTRGAGEGPPAHLRLVEDFLSAASVPQAKVR
jgi:probable F420-dependent oxidoreductase